MPPTPARPANVGQIPAAHALHLADVAEALGVPRERLFEAWGLSEAAVADPDRTLDLATLRRLVATTRRLSGEEALGLFLGTRMQVANHGSLGFAAMTAPTIREALAVAARFVPTRTRALALRLHVESERAAILIEEQADFGEARDVVLIALVVGIWHIGQTLVGRPLVGDVDFPFPAPAYAERFATLAPGTVRFEQDATRLAFDASLLDAPLVMADAAAHRRACEQCERELGDHLDREQLSPTVRRALERSPPPELTEVASELGVSARTLKRRLATEGTTFGALRSAALKERAVLLLGSGKTLEECAQALGYCDAASFSRAFKRWTGRSPGRFRRQAG